PTTAIRPRSPGRCWPRWPSRWRSSPGEATASSWSASATGSPRHWRWSASPSLTASCQPARPNYASSWRSSRCRRLQTTWNELQATGGIRVYPPEGTGALRGLDVRRPGGGHVEGGAVEGAVRGVLTEVDLGQDLPVGRDHGDALRDGSGHEQPPVGGERHPVRNVIVG